MAKIMNKFCKLKTQQGVQDAFNTRNNPETIQTLLLALNLGSEVWIYREKKRQTGSFKVLGIVNTDITIDRGNSLVTLCKAIQLPYIGN